MKKRYILIDSENVQNRLFELLERTNKHDKILIFYTVHHSGRLDEYLKRNLSRKSVEFIECMTGNNALDLQLCGVLSFLVQRHPEREFLLYSNDKGYLSVVRHWQKVGIDVKLLTMDDISVGDEKFTFGTKKKKKKKTNKKSIDTVIVQEECSRQQNNGNSNTVVSQETAGDCEQQAVFDGITDTADAVIMAFDEKLCTGIKERGISKAEYILGVCHSVRASNLAMLYRVLTLGLGVEETKTVYAQFKRDEAFRNKMGRLYYPTKAMRVKEMVSTALKLNELDDSIADLICEIISINGTEDLQQLYHSFIKQMPGNLADRQMIYKAIKPYISVLSAL